MSTEQVCLFPVAIALAVASVPGRIGRHRVNSTLQVAAKESLKCFYPRENDLVWSYKITSNLKNDQCG
jgi:hypothetical protein